MKDSKNYVIAALCLVLCIMAVGFAAFSSTLNISSTATIGSNWKVKFAQTGETVGSFTDPTTNQLTSTNNYQACVLNTASGGVALDSSVNTVSVDGTTFTMNASLNQPGDSVTCYAVVANEGTIAAKLSSINPEINGSDTFITFTPSLPAANSVLAAGGATVVSVTAAYNDVTGTPTTSPYSVSYTASLNYVQNTSN